jgi:hypothetical protein
VLGHTSLQQPVPVFGDRGRILHFLTKIQSHEPVKVEKIREMKEAIADRPLAMVSGISENVVQYVPYPDCFWVETGISDSHAVLNPARVRAFAHLLR